MARVSVRARCRRDILQAAEYLENESGLELAERFLDAFDSTTAKLALTLGPERSAGFSSRLFAICAAGPLKDLKIG